MGEYSFLTRTNTAPKQENEKGLRSQKASPNRLEYGYDYDGETFLLNKVTRKKLAKINILNTSCRVAKETLLYKKGVTCKKLPYNVCKTETNEEQK